MKSEQFKTEVKFQHLVISKEYLPSPSIIPLVRAFGKGKENLTVSVALCIDLGKRNFSITAIPNKDINPMKAAISKESRPEDEIFNFVEKGDRFIERSVATCECIIEALRIAKETLRNNPEQEAALDEAALDIKKDVLIKDWLIYMLRPDNINTPSIRILNCVRSYSLEGKIKYLREITRDSFLKNRNAGKKSWEEFVKLRGY